MGRIYRFFIEECEGDLGSDFKITTGKNDDILNQLTKVLRVGTGDKLVLLAMENRFGEESFEYFYDIVSAHKKEVMLRFNEKLLCQNELGYELELVICLPNKPDKLSLILQKAVELGVSNIVLVDGDNSQMKHEIKNDRLARIIKEAAEQSERAYVPSFELSGKLSQYLETLSENDRKSLYIAMERLDVSGGLDFPGHGKCMVLIGPEGGFSDNEKRLIQNQELKTFSLGKRILRMETAAIVALGLVSSVQ